MPLKGVKVLDVSRVLSGPFATMILGDMGADVIKVEEPGVGDEIRMWPPFVDGESCAFLSVNRNKRDLTLDLRREEGVEVLTRLAGGCDVLVENFKPGTMERLGLGYDRLSDINPGLIYCSISGYGATGPYRHKPGYDAIIQAHGGLMSITGEARGEPVRAGVSLADISAGFLAALGILAALRARDITGRGQVVDTSLLEGLLSILTYHAQNFLSGGIISGRLGSAHPSAVPYQAFKVRDGALMIGALNQKLWGKLCRALGLESLTDDPMFRTAPDRTANREELSKILIRALAGMEMEEVSKKMEEAGVPYAPINSIDQVFSDPQVLHREMVVEVEHPKLGKLPLTGMPIKFSRTPAGIRRPPPLLGQHTGEILEEMGYSPREIEALRGQGVI